MLYNSTDFTLFLFRIYLVKTCAKRQIIQHAALSCQDKIVKSKKENQKASASPPDIRSFRHYQSDDMLKTCSESQNTRSESCLTQTQIRSSNIFPLFATKTNFRTRTTYEYGDTEDILCVGKTTRKIFNRVSFLRGKCSKFYSLYSSMECI